jgi:hypothetical protein
VLTMVGCACGEIESAEVLVFAGREA